jgi:hypothetical protein
MNQTKLLFSLAFMILLFSTASAVVTPGGLWSNNAQSIEIKDGETATFTAYAVTGRPSMTITGVKMFDSSHNLIKTFESNRQIQSNTYSNTFSVTKAIYSKTGSYTISIIAKDSDGENSYPIYLKVNPIIQPPSNRAPTIISTPIKTVNENKPYKYDVQATDADGDTLTFSLVTAPSFLSINSATGLISGTAPSVSSDKTFTVTVKVSDNKGGTDIQTYTLTVKNIVPPTNKPPVITSAPVTSVKEGEEYRYHIKATDPEGQTIRYSIVLAPSWLRIVREDTGIVSGTAPFVDENTPFTVKVKATDSKGAFDTQTYTLTVKNIDEPEPEPENHAPVISAIPNQAINEKTDYSYSVDAEDEDGDDLEYSLTSKTTASWLSIDENTGEIEGTAPSLDENTPFIVEVKVSDGELSDYDTYILTVKNIDEPEPINHAPKITSTPVKSVDEKEEYEYNVQATDADGDELTFSLTSETTASWLSIDEDTGEIEGTAPSVSSDRSYTVRVKVTDIHGASATQTYTLTVKDIVSCKGCNKAPRVVGDKDIEEDRYLNRNNRKFVYLTEENNSKNNQLSWFEGLVNSIGEFFKNLLGY